MKGSSFPRVSAVRTVVIAGRLSRHWSSSATIERLEPLEGKARAAASPAMDASGARGLHVAVADRRDARPEATRRDASSSPDRSDHRTDWISRGVIDTAPSAQPPEPGGPGVQASSRTATGCTDAVRMFSETLRRSEGSVLRPVFEEPGGGVDRGVSKSSSVPPQRAQLPASPHSA